MKNVILNTLEKNRILLDEIIIKIYFKISIKISAVEDFKILYI
jgi:hypothetical protein